MVNIFNRCYHVHQLYEIKLRMSSVKNKKMIFLKIEGYFRNDFKKGQFAKIKGENRMLSPLMIFLA